MHKGHGIDRGVARDTGVAEAQLSSTRLEVINLRLEFLSMVVAVLARELPQPQATHVAQGVAEKIVGYLAREPVSEDAEEAVAKDLAPIMDSLRHVNASH